MADTQTATQTAANPGTAQTASAAIPFPIASRMQTREAFNTGAVSLATATPTVNNPIQLPAVGYARFLRLEVTVTSTGGTAFTADGPFNIISSLGLRTSAGNDLITPQTGYQIFLMNKYGLPNVSAPYCDPRLGSQYSTTAGTAAHFYLDIPFEIDRETGLGSIPMLAANRSYNLSMTFAPYSVITGASAATVSVSGTYHYWTEPPSAGASNVTQATAPDGTGMISLWQYENYSLTAGDKLMKINNVGNILRTVIFTLRNSSGARIDTNGWPTTAPIQLSLDNEVMWSGYLNDWRKMLIQGYGYTGGTADAALGMDTGVIVMPFHVLAGSISGDPTNSRSQLLPTLDSAQLELRANFGSAVSSLEIQTNNLVPRAATDIYNK